MRKFLSLFLLLSALSFGVELLYNGDFTQKGNSEERADGWIGGYKRIKEGDGFIASCQKSEKTPYCEANSLHFEVSPGSGFTISGKHKGAAAYLFVSFSITGAKPVSIMEGLKPSEDWQEFNFTKQVPANAAQCNVIIRTFSADKPSFFSDIHFDGILPEAENHIGGGIELLRNGSFEKTYGIEDLAAFWEGLYKRTNEEARDGKFSARCLKKVGGSYSEAHSIEIPVKPNTPFELTGYYKGAAPVIYAFFTIQDGKPVSLTAKPPASLNKWSKFIISDNIPENATKCRVLLRSWNEKTPVFFDSIHLFGISPAEPVKTVTQAAGISLEVPPDATPSIVTARAELENYLPKIVKDSITIDGQKLNRIVIGLDAKLGDEESWSIKSEGDTLFLSGGGQRGALYAVYVFLEDFIGIHWWTPWEEFIPAAKNWEFAKISRNGKPFFFSRDLYRSSATISSGTARFAVRNRMNRAGDISIPPELGGARTFGPPYFVHTFARYIGGNVAKEHPEFLAMVDGERNGGQYSGQLCMTNPEMRDYVANAMMKMIAGSWATAEAQGAPRPIYFDLSQNDGSRFCECERCRKMMNETSITDVLLDFVNYVADKVGEKYPDVLVTTLAYHKTVFPPKKIMPRDNVVIRLCDTGLASSDINAPKFDEYRANTEQWAKISKHLMCWEYSLAHWPYPDDMGPQRLCKFYRNNNFDAIFIEMSGEDYLLDCFDMKTWLYAKMMENPDADFEATRQNFLKGYYGEAAPFVDAYRKLVEKAEKRNKLKLNRHRPIGFDFYDLDELIYTHKLFDDAEKAVAGNIVLETRLMRVRASLNILTGFRLARYMDDWKKKGGTAANFPIDRDKLAANMRRLWLKDTARFKEDKALEQQKIKESQISIMENLGTEQKPVPEPPEFKGHHVQHFCPSTLTLHNNPNMTLIKDADAREGCAFQILCTPRDQYFGMPFEAGCYDTAAAKTTLVKKWDTLPTERGFQWLHLGKQHLHMKYYIYLTGSWELQATMNQYLEFGEKDLDIWIRIKFEGPRFYPEDKGKTNRMVVDSISFVEL